MVKKPKLVTFSTTHWSIWKRLKSHHLDGSKRESMDKVNAIARYWKRVNQYQTVTTLK